MAILGIEITIDQIREKIALLSTLPDGKSLENACNDLQAALHANPDASNLLLPEEIGAAVDQIMRVKNVVIAEASVKKTVRDSKKFNFADPNVMNAVLSDL